MSSAIEFYFRSVDRRWKKALRRAHATAPAILMSPYLTSRTAEHVAESTYSSRMHIYTTFSVRNFVTGASSIRTIRRLFDSGTHVYAIPNLHAKVVVVPYSFASIGSQNLTLSGTRNLEATAVFTHEKDVKKVEKQIQPWLEQAHVITHEMIYAVEELVSALDPVVEELLGQADRAQDDLVREAVADSWVHRASVVRGNLQRLRLREHERVPYDLIHKLVAGSAWWYDHPSGTPVPSPRDADRLQEHWNEYRVPYGANKFLAEAAISKCHTMILHYVRQLERGNQPRAEDVRRILFSAVQNSVAGSNDLYYNGAYPLHDDTSHMKFGSHSINVERFVSDILRLSGIGKYLA